MTRARSTCSPAASKNCNAECSHVEVTNASSNDGCCPKGANANTDNDCKPVCGNNVHEGDEQCDGGMGCTADCQIEMTPEQTHCIENFVTPADDACEKCMCLNCTQKVLRLPRQRDCHPRQ